MNVITIMSCPLSTYPELLKRAKEVLAAPDRPDYMEWIGVWGYLNGENWEGIQVFKVERSRIADAVERNDSFFFEKYGDIPGFSFQNRVAYDHEESFKIFRIT